MRVEHSTSEPIQLAAGYEASRTICGVVPVDAETRQGYFGGIRTGVLMNSFLAGLIIGSIAVKGDQWLKGLITTSDPDR